MRKLSWTLRLAGHDDCIFSVRGSRPLAGAGIAATEAATIRVETRVRRVVFTLFLLLR